MSTATHDDGTPLGTRQVFYNKPTGIIDTVYPDSEGVLRSAIYHQTIEEVAERYPGVMVGNLDDVYQEIENDFRHSPVEITMEHFLDMLEVLPPVGWQRTSEAESFKLSERSYGMITSIFVRIGSRYFELADDITMGIDEIVGRCRALS